MRVRPDPDSPPGWGWIISASVFNQNDRSFLAVLVLALTGHYGNPAGNEKPDLVWGKMPDYANHKNPDTLMLERLLSDVVERCEKCETGFVTKQYFWSDSEGASSSQCCDNCLPGLEADYSTEGGEFTSRETKNAALVRGLVARVNLPEAHDEVTSC